MNSNIPRDFKHAEEFIENCTSIDQIRDFFLDIHVKPYLQDYIDKCYGKDKKGQEQEVYRIIKSKEDVINRKNHTQKMIDAYEEKFKQGDKKGYLETALGTIKYAFSEYIIALRKLFSFNMGGRVLDEIFKCSFEEAKSLAQAAFKFEKEIADRQHRNQLNDY